MYSHCGIRTQYGNGAQQRVRSHSGSYNYIRANRARAHTRIAVYLTKSGEIRENLIENRQRITKTYHRRTRYKQKLTE